ncbi:MAG TPA: GTPase HflX [Bacteroidales bacterium]|nr:MAG: GTPase HflX [Bacteroidetes bacterium GWF2_33_38]OFY75409.1 MAG: GTPase HflX [Bacteroidetes bacterium RIFOXYA12_FULL_33_9]OFY84982.1 MAG: GTPase HflX [Bacteroidetes bacterium RIFOXYA2_FULL_33_7]HBF87433.1 GTPase HflX [Bacteroidales bacterium]
MHDSINSEKIEKAVLVGVINQQQSEKEVKDYLDELAFLAETAGAEPVKYFTQKLEFPNSRTYIGTGKLNDVKTYIDENEIKLVIFDDDLTPSQIRNIEKELNCNISDRTNLILEIFAQRAKTSHAKTQVELAQLEYMLPRLTRMWTHLERQRGGTGTRGGSGELQIESDRRIIRDKIAKLKDDLKKIDKQMATQRKNREKLVRVALVGYTNVGKSTIMKLISKADVFAENKLFATLDTTVRKVVINNLPFLLSDTVGFIRKLPHGLVESFKSTLDEVREADILLHVVDISHPNFEDQITIVNQTLKEINAQDIPMILVFNKIDAYQYIEKDEFDLTPRIQENIPLEELQNSWMAKKDTTTIFISATNKINHQEFKDLLYLKIKEVHEKRYPYNSFLY